jgi:signal transduction histidine kinase
MASAALAPRRFQRAPRRRDNIAVRTLGSVGACAALVVFGTAIFGSVEVRSALDLELLLWALTASMGGMAVLQFGEGRPVLSMDLPVLLACSYVVGPLPAGMVAFFGTFDQSEVRGEISLPRVLWNHSQTAFSVMAGGSVFHLLGGMEGEFVGAVLAATGGFLADATVNYVCVALLVWVSDRRGFLSVLQSMTVGSPVAFSLAYMAFGLMSLLVALAYRSVGFGGVVLFVAPLILARDAFFQRFRAEEERRRADAQRAALSNVDERIAVERRDERVLIAASLHDETLQYLYNVSIRAQVIKEDLRSGRLLDLEEDVPPLLQAAESAAISLREVISDLRRSTLGHAGLLDTLALLAKYLQDESGTKFVMSLEEGATGTAECDLVVYQILREAMTNSVRHASADTVWVSVSASQGFISFEAVDNGVGFDLQGERDPRHFGLDLMKERAESLGGELVLFSARGAGTKISGRVPQRPI